MLIPNAEMREEKPWRSEVPKVVGHGLPARDTLVPATLRGSKGEGSNCAAARVGKGIFSQHTSARASLQELEEALQMSL